MSLKNIDLTTALRPSLFPDEVLLFVQDNVGLYEGKYKIPHYQNGHAYLTSHRVCYVDNVEPRKASVGINLKEVERTEFYAGFLKSSAKITLIPKASKRSSAILYDQGASLNATSRSTTASPALRSESPFHLPPKETPAASLATWVCPICTFSNPVPSNFDPGAANEHTPRPPCLACGIKPPLAHVLKAAISGAANRALPTTQSSIRSSLQLRGRGDDTRSRIEVNPDVTKINGADRDSDSSTLSIFTCPRCTFANHPSLMTCELCGAPLLSQASLAPHFTRAESPGPVLQNQSFAGSDILDGTKLSFRGGGEKIFYERLKGALVQRKWLLQGAPPVPKPSHGNSGSESTSSSSAVKAKTAGIAGLEQRGLDLRKNNETVIGNAFEDLEALMASAKEIVALAESFARQTNGTAGSEFTEANELLAQSASALGLVTTKDMLGGGSSSETLYLSELARNLAEFLTDDARGILRKAGGIISLVDLWAVFNRARRGVELVSPTDFEKSARLWEKLSLPVRLRQFRSGVLVVQASDRTDEKTIKALLSWLKDLHSFPPEKDILWDWQEFGRGVTAQDVAERFGWSLGVATEELEMAEERGVLCREESIEGLKFWENLLGSTAGDRDVFWWDPTMKI